MCSKKCSPCSQRSKLALNAIQKACSAIPSWRISITFNGSSASDGLNSRSPESKTLLNRPTAFDGLLLSRTYRGLKASRSARSNDWTYSHRVFTQGRRSFVLSHRKVKYRVFTHERARFVLSHSAFLHRVFTHQHSCIYTRRLVYLHRTERVFTHEAFLKRSELQWLDWPSQPFNTVSN